MSLSETCLDFLHFIESFAEYEKQSIIYLWLLEDPIQDLKTDTCGYFQTYFYKNLFFPNSDSVLQSHKRLTHDVIETFLQELFSTNTNQNERIIDLYKREKKVNSGFRQRLHLSLQVFLLYKKTVKLFKKKTKLVCLILLTLNRFYSFLDHNRVNLFLIFLAS